MSGPEKEPKALSILADAEKCLAEGLHILDSATPEKAQEAAKDAQGPLLTAGALLEVATDAHGINPKLRALAAQGLGSPRQRLSAEILYARTCAGISLVYELLDQHDEAVPYSAVAAELDLKEGDEVIEPIMARILELRLERDKRSRRRKPEPAPALVGIAPRSIGALEEPMTTGRPEINIAAPLALLVMIVGWGLVVWGGAVWLANQPVDFDRSQSEYLPGFGRNDLGNALNVMWENQVREHRREEAQPKLIWGAILAVAGFVTLRFTGVRLAELAQLVEPRFRSREIIPPRLRATLGMANECQPGIPTVDDTVASWRGLGRGIAQGGANANRKPREDLDGTAEREAPAEVAQPPTNSKKSVS